jgi:hypothetical protein
MEMPTTENEKLVQRDTLNEKVAVALGWTYAKEWRNVGTWVAPNGTLWASLPKWETDDGMALQLIKDEEYQINHVDGTFYVALREENGSGQTLAEAVCSVFVALKETK